MRMFPCHLIMYVPAVIRGDCTLIQQYPLDVCDLVRSTIFELDQFGLQDDVAWIKNEFPKWNSRYALPSFVVRALPRDLDFEYPFCFGYLQNHIDKPANGKWAWHLVRLCF